MSSGRRNGFRRLAIGGLLALLSACAAAPSVRHDAARSLDRYVLEGRFGLRDHGASYQGRVQWQHSPQGDRVFIQDPFGGGIAELQDGADGAQMRLASGEVTLAADAPSLMQTLTGVALPVRSVARWLTGRSLPAEGVARDALGRPSQLSTEGWQVRYEYEGDEVAVLPSRVFAENGQGIQLRVAIDTWTLEATQ